jgi:transcriptional regulator with XRE-family HTH domain
MLMNIQDILNLLRQDMTDAEIADEIGTTQPTIWRLRHGKHKSTSYERAKAIEGLARRKGVLPDNQESAA